MQGNQFKIFQATVNDYKAFKAETFTVTTTAQGINVPESCKYCFIEVESDVTDGKAVRYWVHGIKPTSSTGYFRGSGDAFDINEYSNIKNFSVIQGSAGSTTLIITYYR